MDPFGPSLFNMLHDFGGMSRKRKCQDTVHHLNLTLEELFTGTTRFASITRSVMCTLCAGTGCRSGAPRQCRSCGGRGCKMVTRPVFTLALQERVQCDVCHGTGKIIPARDKCLECRGIKVKTESKGFNIPVVPGMKDMQVITFRNQGDQQLGVEPGDLKVVLHEMEHSKFKRSGDNLFLEHDLSLTEALCGFVLSVKHLDGRELVLKPPAGKVVHPGMLLALENEGMPRTKDPNERGALIVKFKLNFPKDYFTSPENIKLLESFLPRLNPKEEIPDLTSENVEEVNLHEMIARGDGPSHHSSEVYRADDDDDDESPREIGCVQQ